MRKTTHSRPVPAKRKWLLPAFTGVLLLVLTGPAQAGDVYSWRTDDGGTAFTDDPKSIPVRYRDRVERQQLTALGDYGRFSRQDVASADRYERRLAERLERLRALNRPQGNSPRAGSRRDLEASSLTLRDGGRDGAGIDLSFPAGETAPAEPIVVETLKMRLRGSSVTQNAEIVRRGDEIIAVRKPQPRQWNLSDRFDEADVLQRLRTQ
jgi:hypothetical protein